MHACIGKILSFANELIRSEKAHRLFSNHGCKSENEAIHYSLFFTLLEEVNNVFMVVNVLQLTNNIFVSAVKVIYAKLQFELKKLYGRVQMRGVFLADVGDGLCMAIHTVSRNIVQIDCGGQNYEVAFNGLTKVINYFFCLDAFVLSHFHIDHYNGLLYASYVQDFPFKIESVFYPRIPMFKEREKFLQCLFAMNARVFGSETGIMAYDLLQTIGRINKGLSFWQSPLSKGNTMNVDGSIFEVLWPPKVVDERIRAEIKGAINDFEKALDEDEDMRHLYNYIREERNVRFYFSEQGQYEPHTDEAHVVHAQRLKKKKLPNIVRKANKSLREAANHFSLVLSASDRLLFFGDAEGFGIRHVVSNLKLKRRTSFLILVTPHHGTHWHDSLGQIRCVNSITSNGIKNCRKMKQQFKEISWRSLATFVNGDIAIPTPPTIGFWQPSPFWHYQVL